ncbi:MAG: class I SAM-dependent methyltransferase [Chloroflexota bacterium]
MKDDPSASTAQNSTRAGDVREWDAAAYHRLSDPQFVWGLRVLERLSLRGDETVIDAGCGSGRLTAELLRRLPAGRVIAIDRSRNMLHEAEAFLLPRFCGRVTFLQADLQELRMSEEVDVVFSTAALHWIRDHPRLFRVLYAALVPGGRLVAQCGGGPNVAAVRERARTLIAGSAFQPYSSAWLDPWEFASEGVTAERLEDAGFVDVRTWLEPDPVTLPGAIEYRSYLATIIFRSHLPVLSPHLQERILDELTAQASRDNPPFTLDYWRLNMGARRP